MPGGPRNDVACSEPTDEIPRLYDDADDFGDGYGQAVSGWIPRLYSGEEDVVREGATTGVKAL